MMIVLLNEAWMCTTASVTFFVVFLRLGAATSVVSGALAILESGQC